MRKPQSQPSLAGLTEAEREQLADWLRHEDYEVVRDRVNKPRPGGFGLDISVKPLRTFYAKVALLDLINGRLPDDKKLTLAQLETLSSTTFNLEPSTFNGVAQIHESILNTTHDLATSGENTPTQLLALQRLADFPARVEIREQRLELDRKKLDHKQEMETFRKEMAEKRFNLAKETFAFRQQQHQDRLALAQHAQALREQQLPRVEKSAIRNPNSAIKHDDLGPLATTLDDVERRACVKFNQPYTGSAPGESPSPTSSEPSSQTPSEPSPATDHSITDYPPSPSSVPSALQSSPPVVQNSATHTPTASLPGGANVPVSPDSSSPLITDHSITDYSTTDHSPPSAIGPGSRHR